MGLGASIFLIAAGLILALAVNVNIAGLDVTTIGWILTAVGVLGLILFYTVWRPRRMIVTTDDVAPRRSVVEERRTYQDPPL